MTTPSLHPHQLSAKDNERFWSKIEVLEPDDCWEWQTGKNAYGYGAFNLAGRMVAAHRVAWEIVAGPIPDGMFVCHHCDNRACVNFAHLFLGTAARNNADMVAKARQAKGEKSGNAKLTEEQVVTIRGLVASGVRQREVAEMFDISRSSVQDACAGRTWKHAKGAIGGASFNNRRGAGAPGAKLKADDVREIRQRAALGETQRELARAFGVSNSAVYKIVNRKTWKHVK